MAENFTYKINFTNKLIESLKAASPDAAGGFLLHLPFEKEKKLYVSAKVVGFDLKQLDQEFDNIFKVLPGGFEVFGVFLRCSDVEAKSEVEAKCRQILPLTHLEEDLGGNYFVLVVNDDDVALYSFHNQVMQLETFDVVDEDCVSSGFMKFHLRGDLGMQVAKCETKEELIQSIESQFHNLTSKLHSRVVAFHFPEIKAVIAPTIWTGLDPTKPCGELLEVLAESSGSKGKGDSSDDVVNVQLLHQLTGENGMDFSICCAPIIHHEHKNYKSMCMPVKADLVLYIHKEEELGALPERLVSAILLQLGAMCSMTCYHSTLDKLYQPQVFHFHPDELDHLVSVMYCRGLSEEDTSTDRQFYHMLLDLPDDRPILRKALTYKWPGEVNPCPYLIDPHLRLKDPSGGGSVHLVKGHYQYRHYMQDGFNDEKWGCAYRSLQTIASWFLMQGYTDKSVPTHRQIQETLVSIGDKDSSIIGSKQWIGSTEVAYVLESMLEVTSKILFVNTGSELESHGRELAMHFDNQGIPVMIGGGVLAHTILGVSFNELTGDTKFLVLDPHYTGADDLKTVTDKGWCSWKDAKFWRDDAHYNLCLPQRPIVF